MRNTARQFPELISSPTKLPATQEKPGGRGRGVEILVILVLLRLMARKALRHRLRTWLSVRGCAMSALLRSRERIWRRSSSLVL
jgi:hypothetical protein